MSLLLCFSGKIGSGKTSISTEVASSLGWSRVGFGDYLRREIERCGGDPDCREALQDFGQELVERDPRQFCRDVLDSGGFAPGDNFVVDGIRHVRIFDNLTSIATPSRARLLYLHVPEEELHKRNQSRKDIQNSDRASDHLVEMETRGDDLINRADGVVNADQKLHKVVEECLNFVRTWNQ